jgi:hypothetical protein
MNSTTLLGLIISISIVNVSLLLPFSYRNVSINPALATTASPHQADSGTLEYFCLKYKDELSVYENDCHEMFDSNEIVKTETGYVAACKIAKFAGHQFPAVVRFLISNIECHAEPMDQFENIFNRAKEAATDVASLFSVR